MGCRIEDLFAGAITSADDLNALLASVSLLQLILDFCVEFGQEYDIVFSCEKSQRGLERKPISKLQRMVSHNKILKWSDNVMYLRIDFVFGSSLNVCCKNRIRKFMASVSSVFHFKLVGYESVFAEILIRKCLLVLMYGLEVVPLDNNSIKLVTQVWNCVSRWLYGVGKFTSTRHLFDNYGTISLRFSLHFIILWMQIRLFRSC